MTTWLHRARFDAVLDAVRGSGAKTVVDLGCRDGAFLVLLLQEPQIRRIVGMDLSLGAITRLRETLRGVPGAAERVEILHASLLDSTAVPAGFDAAVLIETIEHIDPSRLSALEHAVFQAMRPATVVITTPNADFNPLLGVPKHRLRHPDHRFEWSRAKFRAWSAGVARRNNYAASCRDLAGGHPIYGGASQMALFREAHTFKETGWIHERRGLGSV